MVVDSILREHGSDKLTIKPALIDGIKASPGVTRWEDNIFDPSLKLTMRVWPHQNDTGGFFIAVLEKTGSLDHATEKDEMRLPSLKTRLGEAENPEPWLDLLKDRFGLSTTIFDHHPFFRHGADGIYLTSETHWPPAHPRPDSVGLLLLHTRLKYPKLSTAAAMCFGSQATQNYVDLSASQIEAYLTRQPIPITKQQAQFCTGFGYVLVRYQNFVFGLGLYHPSDTETEGVINSMYPKAWASVRVKPN